MIELYFAIAIALLFLGLVFVQSYTSHRKWSRREERKRREYRRKQERAMLESGIEQSRVKLIAFLAARATGASHFRFLLAMVVWHEL